ncbi:MAG: efflux RND transporter periplasmic adaptor subunit [Caldilineaceae bacterium]|nr:efflux RND transporter periplasmic adaptor subunit [Caldilineaceae bacterium]
MLIACFRPYRVCALRPGLAAALLLAAALTGACGIAGAPDEGAGGAPVTGTPARAADLADPRAPDVDGTARDAPHVYTASILPAEQVTVIAEVAGQVIEVSVQVGDRADAGDILLRLDSTALEAQRAQALAALQAAQAELELLRVVADDADIEAARAAVAAADAAYKSALAGPAATEIAGVEARLRQAEAAFKVAQTAYNQVAWNPAIATLPESRRLERARLGLDAAQTAYDQLVKVSAPDAITAAYAELAEARARLRRLEEGAEPVEIQAAEAQVRQAETALYLAQLQLGKATLRAPIPGIVAQVNIAAGAMAAPNAPVASLISPEVKIVIPLDEAKLALVHSGQAAEIEVSAYPGETFPGVVTTVAPSADPTTHTVPVTIRPTGDDARLIPGMLATVRLVTE